jgi:hypothetical protein
VAAVQTLSRIDTKETAMKRLLASSLVFCALMVVTVAAAGTNFAGTWVLDKSKSEGLQRGMDTAQSITMVVTQDDKQIITETKVVGQDGEARPSQPFTYKLDGSKTNVDVTGRMPAKATLSAKWMGDGKVLELDQDRVMNLQGNEVNVTIKEHWELADGGKVLKLHRTTESPRGTQESKLTFNKQ